ncbi:MAG: hypothetical protein ACM3JQ_00910, partial [Candidatus Eiseniibacteriota bacterium]
MQSKHIDKIYLDTNILYSYITGGKYDYNFQKSKILLEEIIRRENKIGVISDLVILEMINIIRVKSIQKEKFRGKIKNNPHIAIQLKRMVNRYIGMFINKITEWVSAGKLLIIKVEISMAKFYKKVRNIQENFFGDILDSYKCKMCDAHHDSYIFRGIDHYDIQHALIAKIGNVNRFATFDK